MSNLISGKEALIALANGEEVEGNIGHGWCPIPLDKDVLLNSFVSEKNRNGVDVKFRVKRPTITINGIEVPAPFKPAYDERYWHISTSFKHGYTLGRNWNRKTDEVEAQFGAWRTEDEIKQVVAALRSVFNSNWNPK